MESDGDSGSDEEWYKRMEEAGSRYDEPVAASAPPVAAAKAELQDDDAYFENVHKVNCETAGRGFADENDSIWQTMLSSLAKETSGVSAPGQLRFLTAADAAAIQALREWLTGFLPKSCKSVAEVNLFSVTTMDDLLLCTDDPANPSVVCYMKNAQIRLEVSFFTPYLHNEEVMQALLTTIRSVQSRIGLVDLVLCGTDCALYECAVLPALQARWTPQWVENCGHYYFEELLAPTRAPLEVQMPDGFEACDLRLEDADIINSTWKYVSSTSLSLVKRMIVQPLCCGVRRIEDQQLVTWFLSYPDGSMGMLQTLPEFRGKGLARAVAQVLLNKWLSVHAAERRPIAPFLYIEENNVASQNLFTSLGFTKINDVVWAGLTLT